MLLIDYFERTAQSAPDRPFLHFVSEEDRSDIHLSYAQANQFASHRARELMDLGVGRKSILALLMHNSPDWIVTYLACQKIGAVCVGLHPTLTPPELVSMLESVGANHLVYGEDFATLASELRVTTSGISVAGVTDMSNDTPVPTAPPLPRNADISERDGLAATFTSGTTGGAHKAGLQTHGAVMRAISGYVECLKTGEHDRIMLVTPLSHSASLNWGVSLVLMSAGTLVLARRFSASRFWEQAARSRPTVLWTMATILYILQQQAASEAERLALIGLRFVFGAGSSPRRAVLEARWGCPVIDGYGMTETFGTLTSFIAEDNPFSYACMGSPVPGIDLQVVDITTRRECQPEEVGEIVARFGQGFAGYLNNAAGTQDAVHDGWFRTGDLAFRDAAGRFYFVDRLKSIIRRGGENISSLEVEECLAKHPDVREAIALAQPHDVLGEIVLAVLIPHQDGREFDLAEIQAFCDGKLSKFKWPEAVRTLSHGQVPRTGAGKVKKPILLRSLFNAN
ncbi:class I adenylate-forming enzyme family protein [Pandoraea pnomenusa]|uniref:class I adenylate-forming enzyme family protein n=1 Tax=Pandoraea pnomenusa TaxID=93220 RepID=UPI0011474A29|nr:class I adenylate-forming enzyme family protein [Pandoraea pnomenusa]QDH60941.1 acyl--CoA ligase [Pandoraea pnomenusa]